MKSYCSTRTKWGRPPPLSSVAAIYGEELLTPLGAQWSKKVPNVTFLKCIELKMGMVHNIMHIILDNNRQMMLINVIVDYNKLGVNVCLGPKV